MKLIKNFLSLLLAFILLFYVIFSRVNKLSLIKNFNDFNIFFILFIVLIFFILMLINLNNLFIKPKNKKINPLIIFLKKTINKYYYVPLEICDKKIKILFNKLFNKKRILYINTFLQYVHNAFKLHQNKIINIYFILKYIPKFIVIIAFMIDVFLFKELHYFYNTLFLLLIPLILQYFKYICFEDYKNSIPMLDSKLEVVDIIPGTKDNLIPMLTITQYLDKVIVYHIQNKRSPFIGKIGLSYSYFNNRTPEQRAKNINYNIVRENYIYYLTWIEKVHLIYSLLTKKEKTLDNIFNLLIFICYFIGWMYILTFNINDISILTSIQTNIEPFSETIL